MTKLFFVVVGLIALGLIIVVCEKSQNPIETQPVEQDPEINSLAKGGYDEFGYNYQAHIFNGRYCDYDRVIGGDYCDIKLIMKWNDAWLSNKDRDGDGDLDRHYGYPSYIGSGAWLTNHQSGGEGKDHWTYFVKIVAAPADAYVESGNWYTSDGTKIGPVIWGSFAVIQRVESGVGVYDLSPVGPGLGKW